MSAFDRAVDFVLEAEGPHSADPADPGGETVWGISRIANPDMPWPPTKEQAIARYRERYWNAISGDALPWPVSVCVFDCAVNQGVGIAKLLLQREVGVDEDGVFGPMTLNAVDARNADLTAGRYLVRRAVEYGKASAFQYFGRGWLNRIAHLLVFIDAAGKA